MCRPFLKNVTAPGGTNEPRGVRSSVVVVFLFLLLTGASVTLADFEILLKDGQIVMGIDVRRQDGQFLLETATGHVVPIPEELVAVVRITAGSAPGVHKGEPKLLAGTRVDPSGQGPASGLRTSTPTFLAGEEEINSPKTSEQIRVLGPSARFTEVGFDPKWRPRSDWDAKDATEFNPSRWSRNVIDPDWEPRSDYTRKSDRTEFSPSGWAKSVIDPRWVPEDGFKTAKKAERPACSDPLLLLPPTGHPDVRSEAQC